MAEMKISAILFGRRSSVVGRWLGRLAVIRPIPYRSCLGLRAITKGTRGSSSGTRRCYDFYILDLILMSKGRGRQRPCYTHARHRNRGFGEGLQCRLLAEAAEVCSASTSFECRRRRDLRISGSQRGG